MVGTEHRPDGRRPVALTLGAALLVALAAACGGQTGTDDSPNAPGKPAGAGAVGTPFATDGCALWKLLDTPSLAAASPVPFVQLVAIESFEWPAEYTLVLTPRGSRHEAIIAGVRERLAELGDESVVVGVRDEPPNVILELDSSADPNLVYGQLERVRVPCAAE